MSVSQIQHLLAYLGYYTGEIDGIWGNQSRSSCMSFQKAFGSIQIDGIAGAETREALKWAVAGDMFRTGEVESEGKHSGAETFWDEIEFFDREEFRCRCGGKYCSGFPAEPDKTLVRLVNNLRKQAGKPAHCSSGLRCQVWNSIQGGVANSRHLYGKALDFFIDGVSGSKLLAMAQEDPRTNYAYIIEGQYVHVDVN